MDQIDKFIELALHVHAIEFALESKNCRVYNEVNEIPYPVIKNDSALKLEKTSKMIGLISSTISALDSTCGHESRLIDEYRLTLTKLHTEELNLTRRLYLLKVEHFKELAARGALIKQSYSEPLSEVLGSKTYPEHAVLIMSHFLW